jgi:hypothetical protein
VATVDDYIRAFLQVVAYYKFLKGGISGDGPSKEELKLRVAQRRAQRTGDPTVLQKVLLDMHGGEEFAFTIVAAHFYLKFLSNLILRLKGRFDKVKDHKLSTL